MRPARARSWLSAFAMAAVLGGCATPLKGPPPVVDLSTRSCAATADLSHAIALNLPTGSSHDGSSAAVTIDDNASCLAYADGGRSLYAALKLPATDSEYLISVEAMMLINGVFAPRLSLLNEAGLTLRDIPNDAFVFRGNVLSVQIRSHPGERYLLLASQPEKAGQSFLQAQESLRQTYVGYGATIYTGVDVTNQYRFTHSGIVTVSVGPIPEAKPK